MNKNFYKSDLEYYDGFLPLDEISKIAEFDIGDNEYFLMDRTKEGYDCNFHCTEFTLIAEGGYALFSVAITKVSDNRHVESYELELESINIDAINSWKDSVKAILLQDGNMEEEMKNLTYYVINYKINKLIRNEIDIQDFFELAKYMVGDFSEVTKGLSAFSLMDSHNGDLDPNIKARYVSSLKKDYIDEFRID